MNSKLSEESLFAENLKVISNFVLAIIDFYINITFDYKRLNANLQIAFLSI